MTNNGDGGPAIDLGSSQSCLFDTLHIGPKYVKISNAQSELLDNPVAWMQSANNRRQNAVFNVPADVLKTVKQLGERVHRQPPPPSPQPPPSSRPHTPTSSPADAQGQGEPSDTSPDSPEGTPISGWDPSSPLRPPPVPENQTPQNPTRHKSSPAFPDEPEFVTQLPAEFRSSVLQTKKRPTFNDFPPSSLGNDDEMDVEIPTALDTTVTAAHKATAPSKRVIAVAQTRQMATPPSAQIIPSTLPPTLSAAVSSPVKRVAAHSHHPNQRPYKKIPKLYSPVKAAQDPGGGRLTSASFQSSSTFESTPRIVPSTHNQDQSPKEVAPSAKPHHDKDARPLVSVSSDGKDSGQPAQRVLTGEASPEFRPPSWELTPMFPSLETGMTCSNSVVQSPPKTPAPFDLYRMQYPAYKGEIEDFITSCMYIQQHQRKIRTSLYDDFIRAWVEGYLPYVRRCDSASPPAKAQSVFDWYNEIDDDPEYTARVVTRQNIMSFLEFYPEEWNAARSILVQPSKDPQCSTELPSARCETAANKLSSLEIAPNHHGRFQDTSKAEEIRPSTESGPTLPSPSAAPGQKALTTTRANSGSPYQSPSAQVSLIKPKHSLSEGTSRANKRRATDSFINGAHEPSNHLSTATATATAPTTPALGLSPSVTSLPAKNSGRSSPLSNKTKTAKGTASKAKPRPPRVNFATNPMLLEQYYRNKFKSDKNLKNIAPTLGKDGKSIMGSSAPVSDTPIPGQRPR